MLFPTTLLLGLLSIAPSLAIPIGSDALVARDEPQSLEARGELLDLGFGMMEKRDIADEEMFELVARSPEPEPEPLPIPLLGGAVLEGEIEHLERRHLSGVEIEARSATLEPRSKIGDKIKNFFKKIGRGVSIPAILPMDPLTVHLLMAVELMTLPLF
jgi:hypothetical protein